MTQLIFEKKEVIMNKYLTISASTMLLFAGLFLITGCSSSDDAPVSATPTPTPTVSANAVEITAANAEATVAASVATASTFEDGILNDGHNISYNGRVWFEGSLVIS